MKNVVVMSIENGNMLVSGVTVKVIAVLEDSVLYFVVDNSDGIVEDVDGVINVVVLTNEDWIMKGSAVLVMVKVVLDNSVL